MYDLNILQHHGVKGQKWGVRRYQYQDGSLTPRGRKLKQIRNMSDGSVKKAVATLSLKLDDTVKYAKFKVTGHQYVDSYLSDKTTFKRIQTSKDFENFAFYATYTKADSNKYMGLFGKNLKSRAMAEAKNAKKQGLDNWKELETKAKDMKVYQLEIKAVKKLKVPSDDNAGSITANLLREKEFKDNVIASIADSKTKMKRPTQQLLFNQAEKALAKDPSRLTNAERVNIYKALNLSLTNHNAQQVAAQDRFYSELKKKGYNALLDYNDKQYSSYHAKRPMIVFDLDSVKLNAVTETNPKVVDKYYKKYNAERIRKEIGANTIGFVSNLAKVGYDDMNSYVKAKTDDYLNR